MITCILLSAGLSERFGSPKALAPIAKNNVIQHLQNTFLESTCDNIVVVLGANHKDIEPFIFIHKRIRVVYNKDYYFGQTSSIQAGLKAVENSSAGIMFQPVDCPLVQASSVDTIIDCFKKNSPDLLIPCYQGKKGHPPIFHQRLRQTILELPLTLGLNSLFSYNPPQTLDIDDPGILKSFNTPEEFEAIKKPC